MKKGIIWRVGSGEHINIWSDPWIPRNNTRKAISHKGNNLITRVRDLINPIANSWDEDLVMPTFVPEDARIILQIRIQEHDDDFIAWHYDKRGTFSVKSAYRVAKNSAARKSRTGLTLSSSSNEEHGEFDQQRLRLLPLPNNVLHFLWRLSTNSLPWRSYKAEYGGRNSLSYMFQISRRGGTLLFYV